MLSCTEICNYNNLKGGVIVTLKARTVFVRLVIVPIIAYAGLIVFEASAAWSVIALRGIIAGMACIFIWYLLDRVTE